LIRIEASKISVRALRGTIVAVSAVTAAPMITRAAFQRTGADVVVSCANVFCVCGTAAPNNTVITGMIRSADLICVSCPLYLVPFTYIHSFML
jgi:hypothetical protein